MKAVILAGGYGTRLSEETAIKPKPMVEIGHKPILWHIMKIYDYYGVKDFVICCGYKGEIIKKYFADYWLTNSDWTIDLGKNKFEIINKQDEDWKVSVIDTGIGTETGGRLLRLGEFLKNEDNFFMTYGDGVGNIQIDKLLNFHREHGSIATMTVVDTPPRYGLVNSVNNKVVSFQEKPGVDSYNVNAGFFVLSSNIFDFIENDYSIFEEHVLPKLASMQELQSCLHSGFWKPMDTLKDKYELENFGNKTKLHGKFGKLR